VFVKERGKKKEGTVKFLPVMVEGKDSRENVVRERHGLRRGFEHHSHKFLNISNEETIRGSSYSLVEEMSLNFPWSPPERECYLEQK